MRLSRSGSVFKRRKDQKFRNKFRGKKKHKRLDAICESTYNRSHGGVQGVESSEFNNGGDGLQLRRSSRARRAPVLLDSSPMPPKKRRKVDVTVASVDKARRGHKVKCETPCLSLGDLDGHSGGWGPRLRSRGKTGSFSRRQGGESSGRRKRKLLEDFDVAIDDDTQLQCYDNEEPVVSNKSTVVKSKRPGRIEASNFSTNGSQENDLRGDAKDTEGKDWDAKETEGKNRDVKYTEEKNRDVVDSIRNEASEAMDQGRGLCLEINLEYRSENGTKDCCADSPLGEAEESTGQRDSESEKRYCNDSMEIREVFVGIEKLACDPVPDQVNGIKSDCATAKEPKDVGHPCRSCENDTRKESDRKYNNLDVPDSKPRIKLGRCCGLCGGGTDGKPPKILVVEGSGSDDEAYSGSSASEEPNYDVWDGFGDQPGWLGRLLGPINDRFGIAGIWVHQHCAVWSPEVYFAGLGCLKNVRAALYRGRVLKCNRCRRPGATIGCRVDRCPKTYHLPCARAEGCIFDHRKFLIACTDHRHLFQPHGIQLAERLKKMKAKKLKLELRKMANDACRKDIEAEEKWLDNCGEDEEFLKRESKRLHRDLCRIAPVYIGGAKSEDETQFQGWESVAGLQDVIRCMKEVVILPLLYPELFNNLGIVPPRGVLLHGYPGTGKTLVVRALVGSCARGDRRIAYFARKGADCLGKYVGDAERQLRLLFQVAEKSQPSIIFFDEIDGLAPCRTKQQDQTHNSVVSTLLALMDGLKSRGSVIVIGATNRADAIDPALRRPGRFDREIYFPLPSLKDREAILSLHTRKWPKPIIGSLLDFVARQTVGYAGADLQALCTQAAIIALRRSFPLQEVLSAAESKGFHSKCPTLPAFSVEERDWLKALSCAPPPCSRRESGVALNDVISSPLKTHLVPCLLKPLTRLLIHLHLDEHIWLPPSLLKASSLVKHVFVSALDSKGVKVSENWWTHIDDLLQDFDVTNEIEKSLLLANVLIGESNLCGSNMIEENPGDGYSKAFPLNMQCMGGHSGLVRSVPHASSTKSGFQMLISGNPRSGQRHLASCLLHCFIGNVDVWKVDLASISHEGHGDMIHGLTHILRRCAGRNLCMLYMPVIDLWAIDTHYTTSEEDCASSSMEPESFYGHHELCPLAEVEMTWGQIAEKKASYLWTSFIEQVESIRVNTSLIILATSELPFSMFPNKIRQFFGSGLVNGSLSSVLVDKVPQFSLQLDGIFDHEKVINSFAVKLSKDLAQHFVQSLHGRNHIREITLKGEAYDEVGGGDGGILHGKSSPIGLRSPVTCMNKTVKGKSNLLLAISTVGYQILCYPHFAELCWVTSKLKDGPCANVSGPWRGWPFNSCIVRPFNSTDKSAAASTSGNIKSKESGLVRGLVAVGLSAYRGEYMSLRDVCSEVRKVLETLVGRIDDKIQAGKDRRQFVRLLSQVAYLEDMVSSWAHTLRSLEADTPISEADTTVHMGSFANHVCKDSCNPESDDHKLDVSNVIKHERDAMDRSPQEVDAKDPVPTDGDEGCLHAGDEVEAKEPSPVVFLDDLSPGGVVYMESSSKGEDAGDRAELGNAFVKLSNGFTESYPHFHAHGPSHDKHVTDVSSAEIGNQSNNVLRLDGNNILSEDACENSGGSDDDVSYALKPASTLTGGGPVATTCYYELCPECFASLHGLLVRSISTKWELKRRSDSTIEDVHDFVASLSANLHLALLSKLSHEDENPGGGMMLENGKYRRYLTCLKFQGTEEFHPDCKNSGELLMMECGCHAMSSKDTDIKENLSQISHPGLESRFILKDGVLANTLDTGTGTDASSYHCKFDKLCLCFLIEWLVTTKEAYSD